MSVLEHLASGTALLGVEGRRAAAMAMNNNMAAGATPIHEGLAGAMASEASAGAEGSGAGAAGPAADA